MGMRLSRIIPESREIDPHVGAVFLIDFHDIHGNPVPDRLTILDTFEAATPEDSRLSSPYCLMALCKWESLRGGEVIKTSYGFYGFSLEEGIGGRKVNADNVAWVVSLKFIPESVARREFEAAKAAQWVPDFACGYEVTQVNPT
jgi:hypothetical protein